MANDRITITWTDDELLQAARAALLYQASWKEGDLLVTMLDALLALTVPNEGE